MRYGLRSVLKYDKLDEYISLHKNAWPEMIKAMQESNITNYTIFIDGNELFTYYDYTGTQYNKDMLKMDKNPTMEKWCEFTKPCFVKYPDGVFYKNMKEIFHFE
jgi:L-rhamnose mutarotase